MILIKDNFCFIQRAQMDRSWIGQARYEIGARITSLGTALFLIAESVVHIALGALSTLANLLTCCYWERAAEWTVTRFESAKTNASLGLSCFLAILSPKLLQNQLIGGPLGAMVREYRMQAGDALIQTKLEKELRCAQNQMLHEQDGEDFQYLVGNLGHVEAEKVGPHDVGVCHFIGQRPTMEDEHLTAHFDLKMNRKVYPVELFGIFDGHGGDEAAKFLKERLRDKLEQTLIEMNPETLTDQGIWNALKMAFVQLNEEFKGDAGSTATVAMILNGKLWTANVGDARTVLVNGNEIMQLTEDANPTDPRYLKGIENRGGAVFWRHGMRVNGQIAVARAFGDHPVGPAMSARPKITAVPMKKIQPNSRLVLACDGIYDVASTRQVGGAMLNQVDQEPSQLARNIVFSAFQAHSTDNLSAMVIKLNSNN